MLFCLFSPWLVECAPMQRKAARLYVPVVAEASASDSSRILACSTGHHKVSIVLRVRWATCPCKRPEVTRIYRQAYRTRCPQERGTTVEVRYASDSRLWDCCLRFIQFCSIERSLTNALSILIMTGRLAGRTKDYTIGKWDLD